jgi:nucleoside-diphosphate-sugar epimerase
LSAAEQLDIHRVICFCSAQVFGCAEGEGEPLYLPIDDAHPLRAARPYGMSKRLAEEMCAAWSSRTRIPTVVLRPVLILTDDELSMMSESEAELGAFVHVDDVANAVCQALTAPVRLHARLILCGPGSFDSGLAERTLDWRPAHATWTS